MIVVDENMDSQRLIAEIEAWYPGRVVSLMLLRPQSIIKDEAIATLLHQVDQATFVTTNVTDFWKKISAHPRYCIINFVLPKERAREVPALLRKLLSLSLFKTKAARMGKIVRVLPTRIEYYEPDGHIHTLS